MKSVELQGTLRDQTGKKASKSLRTQESVPCVLYGTGVNTYFSAPESSFREIIYTPHIFVVNVDINGKKHKAIIQDIQFHPVTDSLVHIDFLEVTDDKKVIVNLPVTTSGNSQGVKEGGKLAMNRKRLRVKGLVKDIPEVVNVDITPLGMGKSIRVADLKINNIEFAEPASTPVVTVKATRAAKEASESAPSKK